VGEKNLVVYGVKHCTEIEGNDGGVVSSFLTAHQHIIGHFSDGGGFATVRGEENTV